MFKDKTLGEVVVTDDNSLTLKNPDHGEDYHSLFGARTEAMELYIGSSGILERFHAEESQDTKVLDVGLGLAYNALATIEAWMKSFHPGHLHLTSLEIDQSLVEVLAAGEAPWSRNWDNSWLSWSRSLAKVGKSEYAAKLTHKDGRAVCTWTVHVGDASQQEKSECKWDSGFDFIWQDPFSPQKNPGLWSETWFGNLKEFSSSQVCLMTYSVARVVRDSLAAAGWKFEKIAAAGAKRHWLRARLP